MRELKFRQAITEPDGTFRWHYWGYLHTDTAGLPVFINPLASVEWDFRPSYQYTGLKVKEGVGVYEGDILKDDTGDIGVVRFGKLPLNKPGDCVCTYQSFYIECKGQLGQAPTWECENIGDWMEVIGNTTDSPTLLESPK